MGVILAQATTMSLAMGSPAFPCPTNLWLGSFVGISSSARWSINSSISDVTDHFDSIVELCFLFLVCLREMASLRELLTCTHAQNSASCLENTLKGSLAFTWDWASGQKCHVYLEFPSALLAKNRLPVSVCLFQSHTILTVYLIPVSNLLFIC